jgi:hypothetical protein
VLLPKSTAGRPISAKYPLTSSGNACIGCRRRAILATCSARAPIRSKSAATCRELTIARKSPAHGAIIRRRLLFSSTLLLLQLPSVGSQIACHLAMLCSATMRVVSRDVIEHLSQTRVISGTVTLVEKWSGTVGFGAAAMKHRSVVHLSGNDGRGDFPPDREAVGHLGTPFGCGQSVPARPKMR